MALSQQELDDEQRRYTEYNKLFTTVIRYTPFGKFYPLMIGASNALTKNLPNRVGVDQDGRPIVVYKGEVGKLFGVWAVPTHERLARELAEKKYGKALLDLFTSGIYGGVTSMLQQNSKKNIIFNISSKEVKQIHDSLPVPSQPISVANQPKPIVPSQPVTVTPAKPNVPTQGNPPPSLVTKIRRWGTYSFNNY